MLPQTMNTPLSGMKARQLFLVQSTVAAAFCYLTSGVYLSGLAILMGAGDMLVSYLSVIVNICGVLILAFSAFLERFQSRKRMTIGLTIFSRLATLLIVIIPVLVPQRLQLSLFLCAVVVAFALQAQTTVALNQWMLGFVDSQRSGRYISLRQTLTLVVTVLLTVFGGWWMDYAKGGYMGFAALFLIAAAFGVADVLLLWRIPDSQARQEASHSCRLRDLIRLPLKNRKFAGFVFYIFSFYLLLNIADSFTMVYLMKYLQLPYQTVTSLYLIISLPQVALLSVWGKISDRYGHDFALKASIWLFAGETLAMFFATAQNYYICIPIAFFIASVANAGFVVAVFNRRYELMPEENRIVYDNFYTAAIGVGFIAGPMLGGLCKGWFSRIPSLGEAMAFGEIRTLYLVSTVGILLLQIFCGKSDKAETGCVREDESDCA